MAKNVHQLKEKLYKYRYLECTEGRKEGRGDNGKECTVFPKEIRERVSKVKKILINYNNDNKSEFPYIFFFIIKEMNKRKNTITKKKNDETKNYKEKKLWNKEL